MNRAEIRTPAAAEPEERATGTRRRAGRVGRSGTLVVRWLGRLCLLAALAACQAAPPPPAGSWAQRAAGPDTAAPPTAEQPAPGPRTETYPSGDSTALAIHFLDVGQGDAVLLRTPDGRAALIDAGRGDPVRMLEGLGIERIDLLVATHPHADHIGGIAHVLARFPVGAYMDNAQTHTTRTYLDLMRTLEGRDEITYLAAEPRTVSLGSLRLEILPLLPVDEVEHNDRSVAIVVRYGSFTAWLSGDSERRQLTHLVEADAVPDVAVLKAPHHGSRNGVTPAFLRAARPEVVVISLGRNAYGHPHPEAMAAYRSTGARIYRTDRDGTVTVFGHEDGTWEVRPDR